MISRKAKQLVPAREQLQTLTPAELTEVSGGGWGGDGDGWGWGDDGWGWGDDDWGWHHHHHHHHHHRWYW